MERKFFSENSGFIPDFLQNLREGKSGYDDKRLKKIEAIETFLIVAMQHPDQYDEWARLSLSWMGGEIKRIFSDSRVDGESIDRLFEIISRLSREITITPFLLQ